MTPISSSQMRSKLYTQGKSIRPFPIIFLLFLCSIYNASAQTQPDFHLKASSNITASQGLVSQWQDPVSGLIVSQDDDINRPILLDNAIGGQPAIQFDENQHLSIPATTGLNIGGPFAQKTLVLVFKTGLDIDSRQILYEQGGGSRGINIYLDAGKVYLNGWNLVKQTWGPSYISKEVLSNKEYVLSFIYDSIEGKISGYLNGGFLGSVACGLMYDHSGTGAFGGVKGNSVYHDGNTTQGFFEGYIAEWLSFNKALNQTERLQLESSLFSTYDITIDPDFWFKADSGVTVSDGKVNQWESLEGKLIATPDNSWNKPILQSSDGITQSAIVFDGGDLLNVNDYEGFNKEGPFDAKTIVLKFKTSSDVASRQVLYEQGGEGNGIGIYIDEGEIYTHAWSFSQGWGSTYINTPIESEQVYTLILELDSHSDSLRTFINGENVGSATGIGLLEDHGQASFGGSTTSTRFHNQSNFKGALYEWRSYNLILNESQQSDLLNALDPKPFITTWKTDNPGLTDSNQILVPTSGTGYDYFVTWVNTQNSTVADTVGPFTGDALLTFPQAGTYQVRIHGEFPRIYFNDEADKDKILTVDQWGNQEWSSMCDAFYGCSNLGIQASDAPDLSYVTDISAMFREALVMNDSIDHWNVSSVENISYLFSGASNYNQDLSAWNIGNVKQMVHAFSGASAFNQSLDQWDIAKVTAMDHMLDSSGLSQENYELTLNGWAEVSVQSDVDLGALGMIYCDDTGRSMLVDTFGWDITGDQRATICPGDQRPFITTWKTDNPGSTEDNQIEIPINTDYVYDYTVSWVNVNDPSQQGSAGPFTGNALLTFPQAGTYQISINGDFPAIENYFQGDQRKIMSIDQWGDISWRVMYRAFYGATNLRVLATDAPDLSQVNNLSEMFLDCTSFNEPIDHWDVSNVTSMYAMFKGAVSFNQPLDSWDVSNVTNMGLMFYSANSFNQPLDSWDVINVTDMRSMFYYASTFNQPLNEWDVSNVTRLSGMFNQATSFNQPLDSWDVSNVTDMQSMFYYASTFNQPLNEWDVSNVTSMYAMFRGAVSFHQLLDSWDVSKVTDMSYMFYYAPTFNQPLNEWDVSNVTRMYDMFGFATSFNQSLASWNIDQVTTMRGMLNSSGLSQVNYEATLNGWASQTVQSNVELGASGLKYCDDSGRNTLTNSYGWNITGDSEGDNCQAPFITTWKTDNPGSTEDNQIEIPTNINHDYDYTVSWVNVNDPSQQGSAGPFTGNALMTFPQAGTYQVSINGDFPSIYFNNEGDKEKILSVDQWGDISWRSMYRAFYGATNLRVPATDAPDLSLVNTLRQMFRNCISFNEPIGHWDVSNVENMYAMLDGATSFNQPLDSWDVSNVTIMSSMFRQATSFNQPLDSWDVSNVTIMSSMFSQATSFNQPLDSWDVSNVTSIGGMFQGAASFNQSLDSWDVSNVTNMGWMFTIATSFNQPLDSWNVGNATNMQGMFHGASSFNQPLDSWDVSNVTNMYGVFEGAVSFNQSLDSWDVGNVTSMAVMFRSATSFDQSLDSWDVSNVTSMSSMFRGATSFDQPLDSWNVSQVTNMFYTFREATSFNQPLDSWDVGNVTDMQEILSSSGLSQENYEATLNGWASQTVQSNVELGATGLKYCDDSGRITLTNSYGWDITGDSQSCSSASSAASTTFDNNYSFETSVETEVLVYPNPFTERISLSYPVAENTEVKINVFDASGKVLMTELKKVTANSQNTSELNVATLGSGVFLVEIQSGKDRFVRKIIKK